MADSLIEAKKALLADWEARRAELDTLIGALRRELGGASSNGQRSETMSTQAIGSINVNDLVTPGEFLGSTQVEAIQTFLSRTGRRPVTLHEIAAALYRGRATEVLIEEEKPLKNLSSLLSKTAIFLSAARGRWGLTEWYPKSVIDKKAARKLEKAGEAAESNGAEKTTEK